MALKTIINVSPERTSPKYDQQDNSFLHTTEPTDPWISFSPLIFQQTTEDYHRLLEQGWMFNYKCDMTPVLSLSVIHIIMIKHGDN